MKELLEKMIIDSINGWTDKDIYALSLYVSDEDGDPRKPTVTLGYNTERQYESEASGDGLASDEEEAMWNYACWLQNEFFVFGTGETAEAVKNWIIENGFDCSDNDNNGDCSDCDGYDDCDDEETSEITKAFVAVLIDVVKDIHEKGILTKKFGEELPILIHELEYYDEIAEQNIEANGEDLVSDFAEWCQGW